MDGISPEALAYLKTNPWPGNVRQLKNWIERAVNLCQGQLLTLDDFPKEKGQKSETGASCFQSEPRPYPRDIAQIEKEAIRDALEESNGNVSKASKRLGIGRATLYRKLKKYNLSLSKTVS